MNRVVLLGRLTKDPELRKTKDDVSVVKFTLAISRRGDKDKTDFINCVAFKGSADAIEKYVKKGNQLCVEGRIQTGSYDAQDGTKRYTFDVIVEGFVFVGNSNSNQPSPTLGNESLDVDEMVLSDDELPF